MAAALFSSPELKSHARFSDRQLTVCLRTYTLSNPSSESQGQFKLDLAQIILGDRRFKPAQISGKTPAQGEIIAKQ
jgi:hypothetical protein